MKREMVAFFFIAVMAGEILFTEALDRFVHPESRIRLSGLSLPTDRFSLKK
ncbi:hypothetical protein [Bacillus sonorensis]|uniref:hypothetical protein n=1 Tax=Bacillus sonorensis TaxID=119858 RepID=UPI000AFDE712|nr:hypothetical protein [Bacillus sonorensis]